MALNIFEKQCNLFIFFPLEHKYSKFQLRLGIWEKGAFGIHTFSVDPTGSGI